MFQDKSIEVPELGHYRLLGKSGLKVSSLCLGAMNFGTKWNHFFGECPKEEAKKIFDLYVESGGNFIDTANVYQFGESEEWLGEWIEEKKIRDKMVIATKYTLPNDMSNVNSSGNSRKSLHLSVESSLKRLRTSYIDILYLHIYDLATPIEEWMKALNDLVERGKVLYLGVSDTPAWVVSRANTIAEMRGWAKFVVYQGKHNILERDMETEITPMCRELGLSIAPWSVLAGGKLTGRVGKADGNNDKSRVSSLSLNEKESEVVEELKKIGQEISKEKGFEVGPAEVSLRWSLEKGMFPILGCRKLYQLESSLKSLRFTLSKEHMERIEKSIPLSPFFPISFIGNDWTKLPFLLTNGASLTN